MMAATNPPPLVPVSGFPRVRQICDEVLRASNIERDVLFEELNSLLPTVDVVRVNIYNYYYLQLVLSIKDLPFSVLRTLLSCGLILRKEFVHLITLCFSNRINEELIQLLVDHDEKPYDIVTSLCRGKSAADSMRIINALDLQIDVQLINVLSSAICYAPPAYEVSYDILKLADDDFRAAIKTGIPDLPARFLKGSEDPKIKFKLLELLVNEYPYDINYRESTGGQLSLLEIVIGWRDISFLDSVLSLHGLDLEAVGRRSTPLNFAIRQDRIDVAV